MSRRVHVVVPSGTLAEEGPAARVVLGVDLSDQGQGGFTRRSEEAVLIDPAGLLFGDDGELASIYRKTHFAADTVSRLQVTTKTHGDARMRFEWLALDGAEAIHGSVDFRVDGGEEPRLTEVDLRSRGDWRGVIELITVQSRARRGPVVLSELALSYTPPGARELSKLAVGDGMVFLGAQGRRAAPLVSGAGCLIIAGGFLPKETLAFEVGVAHRGADSEKPLELYIGHGLPADLGGGADVIALGPRSGWSTYRWRAPDTLPKCPTGSDRAAPWVLRLSGPEGSYVYVTDAWREPPTPAPTSPPNEVPEKPSTAETPDRAQANVLLITADTLRRDFLPMYGDKITQTPALDRLAASGVVFEDVTTVANVTLPSHASILSSLYPKDHGCLDNITGLANEVVLLPEILARHDYATGAVIGSSVLSAAPTNLAQGFDAFYDLPQVGVRDADTITDDAIDFVERNQGRPFFLWVHYYDPHMPYEAPADDLANYYAGDPRDPAHGPPIGDRSPHDVFRDVTDWEYPIAQYRAEITSMDREIGRLLATLDEAGLTNNTLVAFTADHGESLTEDGVYFNHAGLFPNTVRVPWTLSGPGVPSKRRVLEPMETIDIAPTLMHALGLPGLNVARGRTWSPDQILPRDRPRFFQHSHGLEVGMRTARFHAMLHLREHVRGYGESPREVGDLELFLREDGGDDSSQEVSVTHPADANAFRQQVLRWLSDTIGFEGIDQDLTEEREQALRELGYLGG